MHTDPETKRRFRLLAFPLALFLGACLLWAKADDDFGLSDGGSAEPKSEEQAESPDDFSPDAAAVVDAQKSQDGDKDGDVPTQNVMDEQQVSFPKAGEAATYLEAFRIVAKESDRTIRFVAKDEDGIPRIVLTNVLAALEKPYQPSNEKDADKIGEVVRHLLPPEEDVDGWVDEGGPDSRHIYLGTLDAISDWKVQYAVDKLKRNHTRIDFNTGKDGMTIYDAVLLIAEKSGANISVNYMEANDQVSEDDDDAAEAPDAATVDMVAAKPAEDKAAAARRVRFYSTRGQKEEWRNVLRYVLRPAYAFDEKDGEVRVMLKGNLATAQAGERNAIPMELRYVRVYHANPHDIVAKIEALNKGEGESAKLTQNAAAKIMVAPYEEKTGATVHSYRHNLSSSSTSISTGNSQIGGSGTDSSSSWGNLLRPKNPPAILIYDNPGNLDKLEALVRKLDVREKQILIEAIILSLSDDGSRKFGMKLDEMGFGNIPLLNVNWQKTQTKDTGSFSERVAEGAVQGSSFATMVSGDGAFGTDYFVGRGGADVSRDRVWTLGSDEKSPKIGSSFTDLVPHEGKPSRDAGSGADAYTATLNSYMNGRVADRIKNFSAILGPLNFQFIFEMVQEDKYGKLLSSPVLTVGDHNEAVVHVGKVIPILKIETDVQAASVNSVVVEDIEWMELVTGIMMWVGPEVTESGNAVRLWVHPRISEVDADKWEYYKETRYPHLVSEELDTRVTVPSGSTLLLGGLTKTSESETIKRVPLLGDIPLLGRLFRWTSKSSVRENLVILIRPTVLDDEEPNTEFEAPAMKIVDPMLEGSGRTLVDVAFKDENDPMKRREKAILAAVGLAKKDDASASADAVSEEADDTGEATADADAEPVESAASDGTAEPTGGNSPDETEPEAPSVVIEMTEADVAAADSSAAASDDPTAK